MAVKNYQILQRDGNNVAVGEFCGIIPDYIEEGKLIYARVLSENENLVVVPWTPCEINGKEWSVKLTIPTGGLYFFEAIPANSENFLFECNRLNRIASVKHFGVGDLYILAGQSNMAGMGKDAAIDPPTLGVHLYANSGNWDIATHPLNDSLGTIYPENAENCTGTSPALSFARILKERLNVPIGLIQSALGGSPLERWHRGEKGDLYNALLKRLKDIGTPAVKGMLWYQGCNDTANPERYYERFMEFISYCREDIGDIYFLTVQLNAWANMENAGDDRHWALIREAQRQVARNDDKIFIVSSLDLPMCDGIHNSSGANVILGTRLAHTALKCIYGLPGQEAPDLLAAKYIDETHIKLCFDRQFDMQYFDERADFMNIEDESGLINGAKLIYDVDGFVFESEKPFTLPAKFHAYWQRYCGKWIAKDFSGMPMLACYNVEIEK
ncbi:MAG: hypothetical protein IJP09_02030 [Clostridia bacterium]|nr:hypothetical protein [Clostridia bacterium]